MIVIRDPQKNRGMVVITQPAPTILATDYKSPPLMIECYETDSIQPRTRRHLPNDQGELLQDEPRQLREGGVDGSNWSDGV